MVGKRTIPFSLEGGGTLFNPMAPPKILIDKKGQVFVIIREKERNNKISIAGCKDISTTEWIIKDLTDFSVEAYEPCHDVTLWNERNLLHLYVQKTFQKSHERVKKTKPQMVYVLEWNPDGFFD